MGILALEPHPRLAAPDSPPGLVSPSSSSYSSRPSPPAEKLWDARFGPVSPSMSSYEHSSAADVSTAGKGAEGGPTRKDSTQSAPRQQLPSLSSLFGPPPPLRLLHSPMAERPGPYPATSPLDRPRMPQPQNDRSYATSYFPPQESSPTMSQPRSTYDAKYDHERQALHGLSRSFSGPGSPRYRESEHMRPESRSDVGLSSKWSMHHDAGKHEYALVSRENQPPLRASHDRMSYQYSSNKDSGSSYRDQRSPSGPGLLQASTSASTTTSEGIPSKDGLGPKIWTGSHFLPRFVRAAEVPGEGMCYFYDDGSHCKTVIDGEAVNAHWGVTKAGKPRKRLAIACVTCREKKIKCDPDYPRCVQCEKFGRICKFKNAPRGGHNTSPSTPPAEPEDMRRLGGSANSNDMHRPGSNSSASVSPRTTYRQPSPEPPMPHKRMRLGFDTYPPMTSEPPALMSRTPETAKANAWQHRQPIELPRIHEDVLHRAWQSDPILAVGVTLSGGHRTIASEYAQVARYAQQLIAPSLQLVQARILLALYYIPTPREGFAESRRLTYWACFVLERLNGMFPIRLSSLNPLDIFIRLPCEAEVFQSQQASQAPFFPALPSSSPKMANQSLALSAYPIQVVTIWADVMASVYRTAQGLPSDGQPVVFVESSILRLISWRESLPGQLAYSSGNMDLAAQDGTLGTFLTIHLLYHHGLVKAHRHSNCSGRISAAMRMQCLIMIEKEAQQLLEITGMLEVLLQTRRTPLKAPPPFMSYAVLEAADVLTAEGSLWEISVLWDRLVVASNVVEAASMVWDEARRHQATLEHRLDALRRLRDLQPGAASTVGGRAFDNENEGQDSILPLGKCWQMDDPMDTTFTRIVDIVYTRV
ncbi:fungal specific transcription factor [Colletotrichum orchidophilum]|uniref:Fungal specific transcription factor n=1 Tax=Colletotrichum orchidophilum TaxID=1209926 RepID=A0A1G4AM23_9PEZI|nr:fungal specific transcription factor [Colletotrichum orchidophilum]OHE90219.1 fungal specific transcription factor [Colletotrichum orchidophilum]